MQLAKAVASAAAALVLKAKNVAQKTEDSALQTQVIAAATQCALSTSQLVACTKVSSKVNPSLVWLQASPGWWQLHGVWVCQGHVSSAGTLGICHQDRGLPQAEVPATVPKH